MKTEIIYTPHTKLKPLNFYFVPCIYWYSECKARPKWRSLNFSWLWWTYVIKFDE